MAEAKRLRPPVSEQESAMAQQSDEDFDDGFPPRLFEAFVVSGLAPSSDGAEKAKKGADKQLEPAMLFCFAPANVDLLQYKAVPDFSFPDQALLGRKDTKGVLAADKAARETFSFVLTDAESHRLYGFCRRYTASAGVEVACVLTRHCWYDVFSHLLDMVEQTATSSTGSMGVATLMRKVQAAGYPRPGQSLRISMDGILPSVRELCITRPLNTSRCRYDQRLCVLFKSMPVSKAVMLFFLMLTERRIILMSNRTSKLSDCAHALSSLLYPFEWQHIYIPVLVPKMLDYVCAPMPFMIGMHIAMLPSMKQLPMEEVVMVDLDRGRLRYNEKDIAHLPDEHFDGMVNALNHCIEHATGDDNVDWAPLANVFLDFFLCVFSGYRRHVKWSEDRASFDKEGFAKSHRKNICKFLAEFEHSQMYEVFFNERTQHDISESTFLDDPFEIAIFNLTGPSGSKSQNDLYGHTEERAKSAEEKPSKMSNMTRFLHSMGEAVGAASPVKKSSAYKPVYLSNEHGYVRGVHMLSKVYTDLGLLRSAQGAGSAGSQRGEWEEVGRMEALEWSEQWFGPSAARWAMKQGGGGAKGGAGKELGLKEGMLMNHMDLSEEELETQTLYFKELNEQRRLQLEAEAAGDGGAAAAAAGVPEGVAVGVPAVPEGQTVAGGGGVVLQGLEPAAGAGEAREVGAVATGSGGGVLGGAEQPGQVPAAADPLGLVTGEGGSEARGVVAAAADPLGLVTGDGVTGWDAGSGGVTAGAEGGEGGGGGGRGDGEGEGGAGESELLGGLGLLPMKQPLLGGGDEEGGEMGDAGRGVSTGGLIDGIEGGGDEGRGWDGGASGAAGLEQVGGAAGDGIGNVDEDLANLLGVGGSEQAAPA